MKNACTQGEYLNSLSQSRQASTLHWIDRAHLELRSYNWRASIHEFSTLREAVPDNTLDALHLPTNMSYVQDIVSKEPLIASCPDQARFLFLVKWGSRFSAVRARQTGFDEASLCTLHCVDMNKLLKKG